MWYQICPSLGDKREIDTKAVTAVRGHKLKHILQGGLLKCILAIFKKQCFNCSCVQNNLIEGEVSLCPTALHKNETFSLQVYPKQDGEIQNRPRRESFYSIVFFDPNSLLYQICLREFFLESCKQFQQQLNLCFAK
jgi:hypothetical protein